jgi:hypothetical protein
VQSLSLPNFRTFLEHKKKFPSPKGHQQYVVKKLGLLLIPERENPRASQQDM